MRIIQRRRLLIAGLAIAALALTACSGGTGGGGPDATDSSALPGTGWTRADRADVSDGGSLNLAIDAVPANWNLRNLDSGVADDQFLSNLFLANYVSNTEDGGWEANPDYAESIELTSEDPQTVEIRINPKAVWSDGTPMGVADFVSTWTSLNGTNEAYAPTATNIWKDVASVEAGDDDQHVVITFAHKNADWPLMLTNIWPAWLGDTPEHFNSLWATGPFAADGATYVSGGPFILSKFDQTGAVVNFVPNPAWWGEKPKLDALNFRQVSRAGLAQAFANQEIDVINIGTTVDSYTTAKSRNDAEIQRSLGTIWSHITLNGRSEVFSDVQVRQAFAKSLNRDVLAQARLGAVDAPIQLLDNLILLPGQDGYTDDASKVLGFDLDGAKQLLDDAGWKAGEDGIRERNGASLTVRFVITADNPVSAETAQQVQAQVKEAGFDLTIDTVPSADFFTKYVSTETRDFDAVPFSWVGTAFPISDAESLFSPADSGQNYPGVTDDDLPALWKEANAELDPQKRLKIVQQLDEKVVALAGTLPLYPVPLTYGVKAGLVNYGPTQFETIDWTAVGWKQ
ncbi:ABC transporter family substrate-binding protein [Plantibacter sp. YIM 135249]|uniref:ABC transporter family substrate-binding protein n=1 Tax=Plantibacter sp. YIM 135249 TaxID=3423918 RepID=UPI003D34BD8A